MQGQPKRQEAERAEGPTGKPTQEAGRAEGPTGKPIQEAGRAEGLTGKSIQEARSGAATTGTDKQEARSGAATTGKKKKKKGPFKVYREGGWLLYFWHGMGLWTWIKLLARGRFDITLNCLPNILTVSIWAPVNSLLWLISETLYGAKAERTQVEPPLFVIGHWRSGTTFLHDLLACDPAHGYPTTYQCFFPNHFLLTGGAVRKWFNVFLPPRRPMDNVPVGVDRPQEDEFAFANLGMGTHYVTLAWPRHGPADMEYLDLVTLPEDKRRKWEKGFMWFVKRLALKHGKRLVMKSPAHTARIATLLKLFPDAKFIHISRNPLAVIPSTRKLWKALDSVQGLHNPAGDDPWIDEFVYNVFDTVFTRYGEDRALIPEGRLVEIAYEDLAADPKGVLAQVYRDLDLGDFARAEPGLDGYLAGQGEYRPNIFDLPDEKRAEIVARCAGYIDRFGYRDAVSQ